MPFDLQQNRIAQYCFNGKKNKENAQNELTSLLKKAIKSIIENYDKLNAKDLESNTHQHDIKIFREFDNIYEGSELLDLFNYIADNCYVKSDDYKLFRKLKEYLIADKNQYLNTSINNSAKFLHDKIQEMHSVLAINLFPEVEEWVDEVDNELKKEMSYHLPRNDNEYIDHSKFEEYTERRKEKIYKSVDESISGVSAQSDPLIPR